MSRCPEKRIPGTSYTLKTDCSKVRKSGIMTARLPDTGPFACPMTQTRHEVCYLSRKPGRHPSESNKILIFYLTRRVLELTQQSQLGLFESSACKQSISGNRVVIIPDVRTFEQSIFGVYEVPGIRFLPDIETSEKASQLCKPASKAEQQGPS